MQGVGFLRYLQWSEGSQLNQYITAVLGSYSYFYFIFILQLKCQQDNFYSFYSFVTKKVLFFCHCKVQANLYQKRNKFLTGFLRHHGKISFKIKKTNYSDT